MNCRSALPSEVSQVSQGVAGLCDTCFENVTLGIAKRKTRSVASVAGVSGEMTEMEGMVVEKQQHKKLAPAKSASPATLPEGLRHLRQLDERQSIQELALGKCRKTRCDSVATLATLGQRWPRGRS